MEDIRRMEADMTADAEDLLWNVLMFKQGDDGVQSENKSECLCSPYNIK